MKKIILCLLATAVHSAVYADVDNDLNFQGFSGLFNVPTGDSLDYGEFHLLKSTLADSLDGRFGDKGTLYTKGSVYSVSASPFPGLEVGMRNIGSGIQQGSDLSANLKYSPTFIPKEWFSLAVGLQDIGGSTNDLDASFIAISKEWGDFRFTAGAGKQKEKKPGLVAPRYDGGFYGIEYQPFEWGALMAEHDGVNATYGLKLKTPLNWLDNEGQFYATLAAKHDFEDGPADNKYFAIGYRGTLFSTIENKLGGKKQKEGQIAKVLDWLFVDSSYAEYQAIDIGLSKYQHVNDKVVTQLGTIKNRLVKQGFERIWLGLDGDTLLIRFENSVFNRNDIDAIGVALGIVAQMAPEKIKTLDLTLSKYGVPTFRFSAEQQQVLAFYEGKLDSFKTTAKQAEQQQIGDMLWVGGSQSPFWTPRISFSPQVRNFVGTEMGVYDYSLALRTNLTLPMWQGGELVVDHDTNIDDSEDFEFGRPFGRYRYNDGIKNLFLRQTFQLPFNIYSSVAVGRSNEMYQEEHDLVAVESSWQSPDGNHRLSAYGAYMEYTEFRGNYREIYTGEYRYYLESLDVSLAIEAGQFWREDRGAKASATFNFGDTQLSVFVQDTDVQMLGIGISIPLTPRRDMRPAAVQLKGNDSWNYSLSTRTDVEGRNPLAPMQAYRPGYLRHLDNTYFNNDRLTLSYVRANMLRLRTAFSELAR